SESGKIFRFAPFFHEQAPGCGEFEPLADRQEHEATECQARRARNSERVRASSLKEPRRQDVFITEFCFSTPRIIMQRCLASMTTATPPGCNVRMSASAISVVSCSWICNLRAKTSTMRATLERPI